jgi:tetratricopeptide (TPR) repeat protein
MAVKTEKDLPEFHQATWLKAMSAMQLNNYGYTVQLLQPLLKSHPEFLDGRKLVRQAEIAKTGGKAPFLSTASFTAIKIQGLLKKDPLAAIEAIEKALENDPRNAHLNQLLKEAASAAKLPETAAFALETILDGDPKNIKLMHELARFYMGTSLPEKAQTLYQKILAISPNDLAAIKGSKDASANNSMQKGGWEKEETSYRDLIKDKDQAVALEQKSRVVRSEEMLDNLLAELHAKAEAEPEGVDTARRIAELYEQKEDFENAVSWFNYAAALTSNSDSALVRKASDLQIRQFDAAITSREEFIATQPETPESAQYILELEDLRAQRAGLKIDSAHRRVEQNPTDLLFRFELGEILVAMEKWQEAIPELQKARQNPNVRLRAMALLGKCFTSRSMFDLAAKTLSEAAGEISAMDSLKKEIIYSLALVYEKMGQKEKALESLKQIYEVDYGYRDVAARVEGSY